MSLLAIDMGSSSCKAVAFSLEGQILAERVHSYTPETPRPSWAQMPADVFWDALRNTTHSIAHAVPEDPVEVLAISSHAETFVPVNEELQPVGPAIFNMDSRAVSQADWLARTLNPRHVFDITGLAVHPMYPVPKILWLRENQSGTFRTAAKFLGIIDYLLTRLGLPACIDYSQASRFLAFDIVHKRWSAEILSACELTSDRFSEPVPTGTAVGNLPASIAKDLGLSAGTPVVIGGHDQPCAALGMGVVEAGRVSASLGTYECLLAASETPSLNDVAYGANLNTYCHVVPDRYVTLAYFPSGIMLEWFLHLLYPDRAPVGEICAALEARAPSGPSGLCVTPHLLGTCNPDFNPYATGVIYGLRPNTNAAQIYKGILEGIACELRSMTELLRRVASSFQDLYVTGGGCRSPLGLELRAALTGCRLHRMRCPEAVCLGTAILAGVGTGKYSGLDEAIAQLAQVKDTIDSNPEIAHSYQSQLQQYRLFYSSLAGVRAIRATTAS
ncbi:MAG TPA: FGGY-family carbohydrate kinase [Terriglobales bacterium]|nr:FGGY-family carbohydrate kinase [Terriglobales bacterium]